MLLDSLKYEMLELIELSGEISRYSEMLINCTLDEEKSTRISKKIKELQERFYFLKNKWFN